MKPHIEIKPLRSGGNRVVFIYPYKMEFAAAARALKIRGLMNFGENPIPGKFNYKAFYSDITTSDAETYSNYAMLVRDFYAQDIQDKFNALFPVLEHKSIPSAIQNPNKYMEAQRPIVEYLIEKYRTTSSPLEFYGSKHMAEGVAMLLAILAHPELKGAIIADETGMAKSIQSIIAAKEGGKKRVLIVAPKSARAITWRTEIKKVDPKAKVTLGEPGYLGKPEHEWVVVQWDHLRMFKGVGTLVAWAVYRSDLRSWEKSDVKERGEAPAPPTESEEKAMASVAEVAKDFDLLIADEGHKAQYGHSQRSVGLGAFSQNIPHIFILTGTPVAKKAMQILNLLRLINHPLAKDPDAFLARYDDIEKKVEGKLVVNTQRLDELHLLIRDCYIRREKSQTNLPDLLHFPERIELSKEDLRTVEKMWEKFCEDNKDKIKSDNYPLESVKIGKHHEFVSIVKADYVIDWAKEQVELGEKVTIFTQYTAVYNKFLKAFGATAVGIDGSTSTPQRVERFTKFQNDPKITEFIGNTIAAGESITLTASRELAFNDLTWIPKDQIQVLGRNQRGGQTRECRAHYFIADTEEDIKRFDTFIKDEQVVRSITNRRNDDGSLNEPKWVGDTTGTAIEKQKALVKDDFDWEDAGEEPPKKETQRETWAEMPEWKRKMIMKKRKKDAENKNQEAGGTPTSGVAATQAGMFEQLRKIAPNIKGAWESNFARSVLAGYQEYGRFTEKQTNIVVKILMNNRGKL